MVRQFHIGSAALFLAIALGTYVWPPTAFALLVLVPIYLVGLRDTLQSRRAILRNFPVIGHFRYLLEKIRPEINQYFIESNTDGTPYNRELRSLAYQRSKQELDTVPFGTQRDVYQVGYEWINHSMAAVKHEGPAPRITIGAGRCKQPYAASLLNISAMSFGALSKQAVLSLNGGAARGGFYHNTGEGGISPYHLEPGGDLVWQIGTGYFGCRNHDGTFNPETFEERARLPQVKMIELKLSQGAKPGHGGILPASKVTEEISKIRDVPMGKDVLSPPTHSAFSTPIELLEFITRLRELSGGKPVGFKLCLGNPSEFLGICMAMRETGLSPDFISVDGGEGGTGAAPVEFTNSVGTPLTEGLVFVHNSLRGFGLRKQVKLIASGKILSAFDMATRLAAGADLCNSARGFMFSLGCIQARHCNSNICPVGVATQDPALARGLSVTNKTERVYQLHEHTIEALLELLGAAGIYHPDDLRPHDVYRRVSPTKIQTYAQIFRYVDSGEFLVDVPEGWRHWMSLASPDHFVSKRRREHMQQRRAEQAEQTAPHADGDSTSSPIPRPAPDPTSADRPTA